MNILVCVKQVPDTTEIKIDPVTNTLIREGVPSIVNPFDGYALEMAVRLKEKTGGSVTVLSMGPPQAKNALKDCLTVGADKAYLVSDRLFGGSDTLATSYILSQAIRYLEKETGAFDLIFCGKQAIDGDTAQVGPEIAEHLGIVQATYVSEIDVAESGLVQITREGDSYMEVLEFNAPAVITVIKLPYEPRYGTLKARMAAGKAEIPTITADDLTDIDKTKIGLKGSPTKVKKTFVPSVSKQGVKIEGMDGPQAAQKLVELMSDAKLI